jgi:hypothetical protein
VDLAAAARDVKADLDRLRPRDTVDRPLPFAGGRLVGRFGLIPEDRYEALLQEKLDNDAAALTIVESCRGLLLRSADGSLEELRHDDGRSVRFDLAFARAFDLQPAEETGVAIVLECWKTEGGDVNFLALRGFAMVLMNWMDDTSQPLVDEIVGKSPAGPTSSAPDGQPPAESIPPVS